MRQPHKSVVRFSGKITTVEYHANRIAKRTPHSLQIGFAAVFIQDAPQGEAVY